MAVAEVDAVTAALLVGFVAIWLCPSWRAAPSRAWASAGWSILLIGRAALDRIDDGRSPDRPMSPDLALDTQVNLGLRLTLGLVLGAIVGFEREFHRQPAGFRTHSLVALGSALFTIVSGFGFEGPGADRPGSRRRSCPASASSGREPSSSTGGTSVV